MNRTRWMLAAVAATALLAGCSSAASTSAGSTSAAGTSAAGTSASNSAAASFPVTLAASPGPVTIKARPGRIVSLSATATEDLYAVGAGPQVVAVDDDSDYPANAPVTKLSGLTPNLEAIAKYKPALVIASQNSNGLVSGLGKLGVPVLIEPAVATLDGAYDQIVQIGQATGHTQQAGRTVAAMKSEIAADVKQAGKSHQGLTYYWELSANPYYSVTSATFIGQIVGLFGRRTSPTPPTRPQTAAIRSCPRSTSSPPGPRSSSWRTTSRPTAASPRRSSPPGRAGPRSRR